MKLGAEDRKKLIAACTMGAFALGYMIYTFAGSSGPTNSVPPPTAPVTIKQSVPSPVATKTSRAALDPTLHPEGMELSEALLYRGSGRNIFSLTSVPVQKIVIPKPIAPIRTAPVVQTPINVGPPPLPPIDLRFFGTATRENGSRQAFFLKNDDVFIASEGDIVSRRYKVGAIASNSVEVTDLTNNNRQRLPLATQ